MLKISDIKWHHGRCYHAPPEEKTLEMCRSHGGDHKAYGWSPQIDSRWSDEQKQAYIDGWNQQEKWRSE